MEMPYFIKLIASNIFLSAIVTANGFGSIDLNQYEHEVVSPTKIIFKNISIGEEKFKEVNVSISEFNINVDLISDDTKYFDNESYYFNQTSKITDSSEKIVENKTYKSEFKTLKHFTEVFGRDVEVSILKSNLQGTKIMLSFLDKDKIANFTHKKGDFSHYRFEDDDFIGESWKWRVDKP